MSADTYGVPVRKATWADKVLCAGWVFGYAGILRIFALLQRIEGSGQKGENKGAH
jgi:hypothetical protein